MIEEDKQEVVITISGIPEQYKNILALTLSDFLDFSGFSQEVVTANDPSDEELEELLTAYTEKLDDMTNNIKIKVIEN